MENTPVIIKAADVTPQPIRGMPPEAGQIRRVVASDKLFFNIDEVSPGVSPHRWHRHTRYRSETHEVDYPADFEEIYFIISGTGVMQWRTDGGEVQAQAVGPGDTIHLPQGVVEHQLLNDGAGMLRLAVIGVPPPQRTPL